MQVDRDVRLVACSIGRPYQGRGVNGRTPARVFLEGLPPSTMEAPPDDEIAA
ncbi:hypothetical protein SH611_14585 [Geminicoccaceae bacterium 1502E]|nr:hypothetical protein [Geminicoccaceae bacterium 1502E]MDX6751045.1 hypothetical protein [Geminicoccaceae bacterium 1502E]